MFSVFVFVMEYIVIGSDEIVLREFLYVFVVGDVWWWLW